MLEITYESSASDLTSSQLTGFFVDWPNPPTPDTHLRLLNESDYRIVALHNNKVVGFITAISDKVLSAYIPLLEVLPEYQQQGIGKELLTKMLNVLDKYYMIDLLCDPDMQAFYDSAKMQQTCGMSIRNYAHQNGVAG